MLRDHLIAKLEEILEANRRACRVEDRMAAYKPEDHYPRMVKVPPFPGERLSDKDRAYWAAQDHTGKNSVATFESFYRRKCAPIEPYEPDEPEFVEPEPCKLSEMQEMGCLPVGGLIAGLPLLIVGLSDAFASGVFLIGGLICLGVTAAWVVLKCKADIIDRDNCVRAKKEHEQQVALVRAKYEEDMAAYRTACAEFEKTVQRVLIEYRIWRDIHLQAVAEEKMIAAKLEEDRKAAVEKMEREELEPLLDELDDCNRGFVPDEYLFVLPKLIELIRAGRADTLKEAINLYEEIKYRERELKMQREAEERRRADQERRHREEMDFRANQERTRQQEAREQREAEERRHREEMSQREKMERDRKRNEERAAEDRCDACARKLNCSLRHSKPVSCSAYIPR